MVNQSLEPQRALCRSPTRTNLDIGDAALNITNAGTSGGNICADVHRCQSACLFANRRGVQSPIPGKRDGTAGGAEFDAAGAPYVVLWVHSGQRQRIRHLQILPARRSGSRGTVASTRRSTYLVDRRWSKLFLRFGDKPIHGAGLRGARRMID